jgi:lambda repressor-like predicted transcriptional regulator
MNRKTLSIITLTLAALAGGNAMAQNVGPVDAHAKAQRKDPGSFAAKLSTELSREAVQAELRDAQRMGEMVAIGESGTKLNELFPSRYPAQVASQGLSRDQVLADLREAQRTGEMAAIGESGLKVNELFPGRYTNQR